LIIVRLGEIFFNATEVPEAIPRGISQRESVNELIGGIRVTDTLGPSYKDISFKGLFRGILSIERAKYLDSLAFNGKQVSFSYSTYSYLVVVKSFESTLRMGYQIDYEIVLTVVQDLTIPINFAIPISFSDAIQAAYTEALDLAQFINNGGIIGAMGVVGLALEAAGDLESATTGAITEITNSISNAVNSVNGAINNITG